MNLSQRLANLSPDQRELLQKRMQSRPEGPEPIAIVGMSCRFPGAPDLDSYWKVISEGIDATTDIPPSRWDVESLFDPTGEVAGKMSVRRAGLLEGIDQFDPQFFGISPREAARMDPQQRLLLEVCWEALENGGFSVERLSGSPTGVYVGIGGTDYAKLPAQFKDYFEHIDAHVGTGNALSIAANRISYIFDLRGPSLAVDTACSSSTMAIHLAIQSLRNRECEMALAGGVNAILTPETTIAFSKARMLSPDGRCRPFDAAANGYVRGEGCGIIVLKRLSDAIANEDPIHGIIRASATNQDGRTSGITAPNGLSQQAVIRAAISQAKLEAGRVNYVEAHGTGTPLGDPIEMEALRNVFPRKSPNDEPCYVTSVKANVGHMETVSGVAGIIKVLLMIKNRTIPKQLYLESLNPRITLKGSRLNIPTQPVALPTGGAKFIAGVSSFGFGGANTHLLIEEPAPAPAKDSPNAERGRHVITLSAKSDEALAQMAQRLADTIEQHPALNPADVAYTANCGRVHFTHRAAFAFSDRAHLAQQLSALANRKSSPTLHLRTSRSGVKPRVAFLFTGQGSQQENMGLDLFKSQPVFRSTIEQCSELLKDSLPVPLLSVLYPQLYPRPASTEAHSGALVDQTLYTQPALFAVEYALAKLWQHWGVQPTAVLGHSVGEFVAACIAGCYSLADGLRLIAHRAALMQSLPGNGGMAAVFASPAMVRELIAQMPADTLVVIAAENGPENTVVSGSDPGLEAMRTLCQQLGIVVKPLRVSHAFHSPLMKPIVADWEKFTATIDFQTPKLPFISNVTGKIQQGPLSPEYLTKHLLESVRFNDSMQAVAGLPVDVMLEVGPAPVLLGMGRRCLPADPAVAWLPSLRQAHPDESVIFESLAELEVRGAEIDWAAFDRGWARKRIALPTYPFQRQRCWLEDSSEHDTDADSIVRSSLHPLLGGLVPTALNYTVYENSLSTKSHPYLADHRVQGSILYPAAGYLELALSAAHHGFGAGVHRLKNFSIQQAMFLIPDSWRRLQTVVSDTESIEIFSCSGTDRNQKWSLHGFGKLEKDYSGSQTPSAPPEYSTVRDRVIDVQEHEDFYNFLDQRQLVYGPHFRMLKRLSRTEQEALGEIECTPEMVAQFPQYHLHPVVGDALLQTFCGLVPLMPDGSYSPFTYVPTLLGSVRLFGKPEGRLWTYGRRTSTCTSDSPEFVEGDVWLLDDSGNVIAELLNVRVSRMGQSNPTDASGTRQTLVHRTQWVPSSDDSASAEKISLAGKRLLVFADDSGIGNQLLDQLASLGAVPLVVRPGTEFRNCSDNGKYTHLELRPDVASDYQQLFQLLKSDTALAGIVYLWNLNSPQETEPQPATPAARPLADCGRVLALLQAMLQHAKLDPKGAGVLWVSRGAQWIDEQPGQIDPNQAPLWGMVRVAMTEQPELGHRLLDLPIEASPSDAATTIGQELISASPESQLAYRDGQRYVARLMTYEGADTSAKGQMLASSVTIPDGPYRLRFRQAGSFDSLYFEPCERRPLEPHEVEVRTEAAGLNFSDVLKAMGLYPGITDLIVPLGIECSGVVTAVGSGVTRFQVGDAVLGVAPFSFGAYVTTPEYTLINRPQHWTAADAASVPIAYLTTWYALVYLGRMQPGERVLIHAGAGGVGLAAIQIAQQLGAEVFATAGSPAKRDFLHSLGVKHVFDSRTLDFADQILAVTEGEGVDLVLNSLPGEVITKSLSILRAYGRFLEIGKTDIYQNRPLGLSPFQDNLSYHAIDLDRVLRQRPQLIRTLFNELDEQFAANSLQPLPCTTFQAEEIAEAFRYMAQRKNIGKVIVAFEQTSPEPKSGDAVHDSTAAASQVHGTVLITGGLGALGLQLAQRLVQSKVTQHVALLARSNPTEEQIQRIRVLREFAEVVVLRGDVSNRDSLQAALSTIPSEFPPLRRIYHAAGVLDDGLLMDMSPERLLRPLVPKVQGTWNLHELTLEAPLEQFVLFSSIAAWLGSPGQGNYAAGNLFLDAFAAYRRSLDLPATSIAWGPWDESGMAADDALRSQLQSRGMRLLDPEEGLDLLESLLASDLPAVAVMDVDWPAMIKNLRTVPAYLCEFARPDSTGENKSDSNVDQEFLDTLQRTAATQRNELLGQYFAQELARIMGWEAMQIDQTQPLSELGMDSLIALELKNNIERRLAVAIPMSAFMDSPSIRSLASSVVGMLVQDSDSAPTASAEAYQPIVSLKSTGSKSPWFCLHPLGGSLSCYLELVQHADPERPFLGISGRGSDGVLTPPDSLAAMLDEYVTAIRQQQPQGPYYLLGWSAGGVFAYELSRRLQATGEQVAKLVLIDTPLPSIYQQVELDDDMQFLEDFIRFSNQFLNANLEVTAQQLRDAGEGDAPWQLLLQEGKQHGILAKHVTIDYIKRLVETSRAHALFIKTLQLEAPFATFDLIRPEDPSVLAATCQQAAIDDMGWEAATGTKPKLHQVLGDHFSMLKGEQARQLMDCIEALAQSEF